ncbi:MAG: glycosidase, partial [Alphaproteobacteria bacterium]
AVPENSLRFILSLRGVGEGHISSVTFRTGFCAADGTIAINPPSPMPLVLETENISGEDGPDAGIRIKCDGSHDLSEIVIFPTTPSQRGGIEDLRLVRFLDDDGRATYFGTYTAFRAVSTRSDSSGIPFAAPL